MFFFFSIRHISGNILLFCSSLMIIFQMFHYSICNSYFMGDISEPYLLFISSPRTIYFRYSCFLSKNFIFSIFYSFRPAYVSFAFVDISTDCTAITNNKILPNHACLYAAPFVGQPLS